MLNRITVDAAVSLWGNDLAVSLNGLVAKTAGITDGTKVRLTAGQGGIVIETVAASAPGLTALLAAFDPVSHSGEAMVFAPIGKEII